MDFNNDPCLEAQSETWSVPNIRPDMRFDSAPLTLNHPEFQPGIINESIHSNDPPYLNPLQNFDDMDDSQFDLVQNNRLYDNQNREASHFQEVLGSNGEGSLSSISTPPNQISSLKSPDTLTSSIDEIKKLSSAKPKAAKSRKQQLDEQDAALIAKDDAELDEEELQMKRKAQNRAAQRAFRERKESKMKELEAKLLESDRERQQLKEKLERITKENLHFQTENEILKSNKANSPLQDADQPPLASKFTFPKSESEFIDGLVGSKHHIYPDHVRKIYYEPKEPQKKILVIGAVWDYLMLQAEERNLDLDSVDIDEIMAKLKGNERCHGFGPAYPLELVDKVIAECCDSHM